MAIEIRQLLFGERPINYHKTVSSKPETSLDPSSEGSAPSPSGADAPASHGPGANGSNSALPLAGDSGDGSKDAVLVQAAQSGDRAAFTEIVQRHQGAVYGYFRARVLQPSDAEDLTQEVFLRCYTCWARFDRTAEVRPWLLGIGRNLLREHARKIKRRKEVAWTELCLELDELVSSDDQVYGDMLVFLPTCLESLGESARQAVELRYGAQLRLSEIGEKLCRSEGAAKLLMFRARQALKNCLDRKHQGDADDR